MLRKPKALQGYGSFVFDQAYSLLTTMLGKCLKSDHVVLLRLAERNISYGGAEETLGRAGVHALHAWYSGYLIPALLVP